MKTNSLNANIASYMSLPFTIVLKKDDEGDYVSRIEELPGCMAHGSSEVEAVQRLRRMQQLWIRDCLEAGDRVPEPKEEQETPERQMGSARSFGGCTSGLLKRQRARVSASISW